MTRRFPGLTFVAAAIAAVPLTCAPAAAQTALAAAKATAPVKAYNAQRTADGQPDLQGVWTNATVTPLERPANLGTKEFYTPEEAEAMEKRALERTPNTDRAGTQADVHYDLSQFGLDRSHATVVANRRTSLIFSPPDGRIPAMLPEAQKKLAAKAAYNRQHTFDGPENRSLSERCLLWPNEGPPMLPVGYNSNLQIVQGPGYVAILQEMIHDVRIIPTDGRPHLPKSVRQWMGDSRGRWEGDTLVVDTTNFTDRTAFRGSSENLHVTERFTRTADDTILYQFTVEDRSTWAQPWSAEIPMTKIAGPIFEYACQEGNYGMANILSGARATEQKAAEEAAKKRAN